MSNMHDELLKRAEEAFGTYKVDYTEYSKQQKKGVYIEKVIFNDPATIILWSNGEKTIVKCGDGETFDPEKGLAMAIVKYVYGNKGNYYNEFKKWLPKDKEESKGEHVNLIKIKRAINTLILYDDYLNNELWKLKDYLKEAIKEK